ncbi:MAG: tRNA pseudouridine(55) synthase TruB [Gammaproteobacteria bacterium]|nr:tRNA pseudouridine(55) synthase TruB [Gammaproteobacteria bacterium]
MSRRSKSHLDAIDGILLYDKEIGLSSNRALQQVKRLLNARKAGHTGSLDPLASGLLPICFGEATKLSQYLLDSDKRYLTTFKLGETTTTGDGEGEVVDKTPVNVTLQQLKQGIARFTGIIEQIPPMYSALKKDGQPLYKLARQGIEVERKPRSVEIFELNLISFDGESVELDVHCSKGFYIRSLAVDLGEELGCGAHVTKLRRTAVGKFLIEDSIGMEDLSAMNNLEQHEQLLPLDAGIGAMQAVSLSDDASYYFFQGQEVRTADDAEEGLVRVYLENGDFIGIGVALSGHRIKPKRLLNTNADNH